MNQRLLIAAPLLASLVSACATTSIIPLHGQTIDQSRQAHEECFEQTHSYWKQTGAALWLPTFYLEKDKQNRDYEDCMFRRGYRASYRDGMGYHPNVEIQTMTEASQAPLIPEPPRGSLEGRLKEIDDLRASGKITEEEYVTLRRKVIETHK